MKTHHSKTGPFAERPYYKLQDIEDICSKSLKAVSLYPDEPSPIRIERFIEKRFGVRPIYEALPDGLLGYTEFGAKGVKGIYIARSLAEEGSKVAERRINTTLAHEAGHGLLHAHLFALEQQIQTLFGEEVDSKAPKILCRNENLPKYGGNTQKRYDGRWWEYQANLSIGPFLIPKLLLERCVDSFMVTSGMLGIKRLDEAYREDAINLVAETFDVNPVVAHIRLQEAYPVNNNFQLTL